MDLNRDIHIYVFLFYKVVQILYEYFGLNPLQIRKKYFWFNLSVSATFQ